MGKLFDKTGIVAGIAGVVDAMDKLSEPTETATEAFEKQSEVFRHETHSLHFKIDSIQQQIRNSRIYSH